MEGAVTISKKLPALKSMQYEELRQLGIQQIQSLAGKLWTDYNSHDPGITMLEILSYAITELGYRINYDIKDLIAQDPNDPNIKDLQNFFTACEILPNCALTFNDYRKLIMDVEVVDEETITIEGEEITQKIYSGVKNAWINCVKDEAEQEIFVDRRNSELSLKPINGVDPQESYFVKTLYDILLEFDKNDKFGDLNENKLSLIFSPQNIDGESPELDDDLLPASGVQFLISIEFPRWDEPDLNWENPVEIKDKISPQKVSVSILNDPTDFEWQIDTSVFYPLISCKDSNLSTANDLITTILQNSFDSFILDEMITLYQVKVQKIQEIICAVKDQLHANRNLCDDFFRFHALKIEEIILCSDIELEATADVEAVEAEILLAIADFLAPKVYFYTIEEMRNRCRRAHRYPIARINKRRKIFTITEALVEDLNNDDTITVEGIAAAGEYTVKCISPNSELANHFNIEVREEIVSENFEDGAVLFKGVVNEEECLTVDQIFEGPKLRHGFIPDDELEKADRKKYIRVSDLIRIIMDIEGVIAVKNIQIANRPQDNDTGIKSRSVRWCLELAVGENYVPRLNIEDSILTFYKGQLPFIGKKEETYARLKELEKNQRPQKIRYPQLDIPVPLGEYKDLENYVSIQEHFPLFYGVGEEGIPGLSALTTEQRKAKEASVKQHKGFLMFFDQLLANFMSQLGHVNELFSMNSDKDALGNYEIDKSYFGQPIYNIVPNASEMNLYVNSNGVHDANLQNIVEAVEVFEPRRNKFLDHMMGRLAETFADYALLTYKVSGVKANKELIEDKLNFLRKYPALSAGRGKGINYRKPFDIWNINNVSGLELRASLLLGIAEKSIEDLVFSSNFMIHESGGIYSFSIEDGLGNVLLENAEDYDSELEVKSVLESIIVNGACKDNYKVKGIGGTYFYELCCGGKVLAKSQRTDYTMSDAIDDRDKSVEILLDELLGNSESNRKNLACSVSNYIKVENFDREPATNTTEAKISFDFKVYNFPEGHIISVEIFSGSLEQTDNEEISDEEIIDKLLWQIISDALDITETTTVFYGNSNLEEIQSLKEFILSKFFSHEGMHLIEHHLLRPRYCDVINGNLVEDSLLDIHVDQDCENCQIIDPYSCVATVILPYWAGRFQNMEVRKFVENTLRTEAPAHVLLNICWVDCKHMHQFEKAYASWLLEKSKKNPDPVKESETLNNLIEALKAARTVYPKGTLHSCDDDDTFKGSVILNNTALGSF